MKDDDEEVPTGVERMADRFRRSLEAHERIGGGGGKMFPKHMRTLPTLGRVVHGDEPFTETEKRIFEMEADQIAEEIASDSDDAWRRTFHVKHMAGAAGLEPCGICGESDPYIGQEQGCEHCGERVERLEHSLGVD